jgi:hypothetical protein
MYLGTYLPSRPGTHVPRQGELVPTEKENWPIDCFHIFMTEEALQSLQYVIHGPVM